MQPITTTAGLKGDLLQLLLACSPGKSCKPTPVCGLYFTSTSTLLFFSFPLPPLSTLSFLLSPSIPPSLPPLFPLR